MFESNRNPVTQMANKMLNGTTLALTLLLSACSSGVSPSGAQAAPIPQYAGGSIGVSSWDNAWDDGPEAGSFDDGYRLGLRNGKILVTRLKQRTVDLEGCSAVGQLQQSLLKVARSVSPPHRGSDLYVAGFYSGYIDSIRNAVGNARKHCGQSRFYDGDFAGQLYGAVACQVETISLTAISSLQLQPLYEGWSGGSSEVQSSCLTTLSATIQSCSSSSEIAQQLEATLQITCTDVSSYF